VPAARLSGGYCTLTFQIRQLSTADYPVVISVIDQWWGGRAMADKLPRLFFQHFTDTSFAAERDRKPVAFGQQMGFQPEPGDAEVDGIPVSSGYDGHGGDRVGFIRSLRGADLLLTPQRPSDSYGGQVIAPRTSIPVRSERQVIRKNCRA
jgi:hypothetical protein